MCLILFAVKPNSQYNLVIAANRDELYARPTLNADFWPDSPGLLAGKDLDMGGTWLGVTRDGRFSAVTNFREDPKSPVPPLSRGDLPFSFLTNHTNPADYCEAIHSQRDQYKGFNLLTADTNHCYYVSNRAARPKKLVPGYYGVSNQLLDCDWPKVSNGRETLTAILNNAARLQPTESVNQIKDLLFDLLRQSVDGSVFSDSFISSETYGTRAATVVLIDTGGNVTFEERTFGKQGLPMQTSAYSFNCAYERG